MGYIADKPVACGALRPLSGDIAQLKRMYAESGTGAALLSNLEQRARDLSYKTIWLSTRIVNSKAVRFYQKHGYQHLQNYEKYAGRDTSICLAKCVF